jgi:uncharacterized protein YaiE (UPF0345 family)
MSPTKCSCVIFGIGYNDRGKKAVGVVIEGDIISMRAEALKMKNVSLW